MAQAQQTAQAPRAHPPRGSTSRPLIYYGWWIVGGAVIAQFIAMGQNQTTNVILGPMTTELGWTRSEFIRPTTLGVVLSGVLGFVVGAQVDRRGARPLMILGTLISSAALILTAYVEELWQFWALRGVALVLGNVLIGNLVVNVTISKWFVDRRGWAIAMAALGVSGWSFLGTPLMGFVVDTYGWRAGWTTMGFATWLLLPVALLMSRQPEDFGLLPDGRREEDAGSARGQASIARAQADFQNSFTRGEAARTPALWLLVLAFGMALTGMTALFAHLVQFFVDAGFTRTDALFFYSTQGACSLIAKFVWGAAMQRIPAKYLVATSFSMAGAATLGLVYTVSSAPWLVVAGFAGLWGLSTGGMIPLSEFVWASYFGRRHIGAVRGLGLPFTVLLTAGGPLFASEVFDRTGSYNLAMVIFAAMWFGGALLILVARRPHQPSIEAVPLAHRLRQPQVTPAAAPHGAMAGVMEGEPSAAVGEARRSPALRIVPPVGEDAAPREIDVSALPLELHARERGRAAGSASAAEPEEPSLLSRRLPPRSYMAAAPPSRAPEAALGPDIAPEPAVAVELAETIEPTDSADALDVAAVVEELDVADAIQLAEAIDPTEARDGLDVAKPVEAVELEEALDSFDVDDMPAAEVKATLEEHALESYELETGEPAADVDRGVVRRAVTLPVPRSPARAAPRPSPWVPRTTGEAVLAGVVTSLVATAALWFLTRPGDRPRS